MNIAALFGQMAPYGYDYSQRDYGTYTNSMNQTDPIVFIVLGLFMLCVVIAVYVVTALFLGRIFKKAGIESWKAWVPVYNQWILLELGDQKGFWSVLSFVPFVSLVSYVFTCIAMYRIGLKLGKEGAFVLWGIFLPLVWIIWLGVDKSTWNDKTDTTNPDDVAPSTPKKPRTPAAM
jgi:hypothetical protein